MDADTPLDRDCEPSGELAQRGPDGKFLKGNSGGPGNPHAAQISRLRAALYGAVSVEDLRDVIASMVSLAKGGDVAAAKLLMDRLLGPSEAADLDHRISEVESLILQRTRYAP